MQECPSLVRADSFMRQNTNCMMYHSGLNGVYRRSDRLCNGRHVFVKRDNPNTVLWFANLSGGMSWCIGPLAEAQELSNKVWASVLSEGMHPASKGMGFWRVFCYHKRAWITQQQATISVHGEQQPVPSASPCTICCERSSNYAVVPCGHMSFCDKCFSEAFSLLRRCPICRKKMNTLMRVFA